jgi:hypothetical protein
MAMGAGFFAGKKRKREQDLFWYGAFNYIYEETTSITYT